MTARGRSTHSRSGLGFEAAASAAGAVSAVSAVDMAATATRDFRVVASCVVQVQREMLYR